MRTTHPIAAICAAMGIGLAFPWAAAAQPAGSGVAPVRVETVRTGPGGPIARVYTARALGDAAPASVVVLATRDRAAGASLAHDLLADGRFGGVAFAVLPLDERTSDRAVSRSIAHLIELGVPPAVLLATADAARRVLPWAMAHPELVRTVVLDGPPGGVIDEDARTFFELGQRLSERTLRVAVIEGDPGGEAERQLRSVAGFSVSRAEGIGAALADALPSTPSPAGVSPELAPQERVPGSGSARVRTFRVTAGEDRERAPGELVSLSVDGPFGGTRSEIGIWIPAGVPASAEAGSVLYALNGLNALGPGPGLSGDLGLDETIDELAGTGRLRAPVVVAVPVDAVLAGGRAADGSALVRRSQAIADWLIETVAPAVDRRLGRSGGGDAVLGAGVAAIPALLASTDASRRFTRLMIESCPAPGASGEALRDALNVAAAGPERAMIACGDQDARPGEPGHRDNAAHAAWTRDLGRAVERLGASPEAVRVRVHPGERAHASDWSGRLGVSLRFVLGG